MRPAPDPVRAALRARRALLADVDLGDGAPERLLTRCDLGGTAQLYELVSGDLVELTSLPEPVASAHYLPGVNQLDAYPRALEFLDEALGR